MKYVADGISYEILDYGIDKLHNVVRGKYIKLFTENVGLGFQIESFHITDEINLIIDPDWNESSEPIAKPVGFDPIDPMSWGDVVWSDIPRIQDASKLNCSKIIASVSTEKAILEYFIESEIVSSGGEIIE